MPAQPTETPTVDPITMVVSDLRLGGAQKVIVALARAWLQEGRRVTVITFDTPSNDFFALPDGTRRVCIGGYQPSGKSITAISNNIRRIVWLRSALKESKARAVVSFVAATNVLTILAGVGLRQRVVVSERNDPSAQDLGRAWNILRRIVYPLSSFVTANSESAITSLRAFVPDHKLRVIPNPLPKLPIANDADRHTEDSFLVVGRLVPQKAHDISIDAFSQIAADIPSWTMNIFGEGAERSNLERQIAALGLTGRVHLSGNSLDLQPHYQSASIYLQPSRFEGQSNALLEAMANGLPAVVSNGAPESLKWVTDGETGRVVPVNDSRALAQCMLRLARDPTDRSRLGRNAFELIASQGDQNLTDSWNRILFGTSSP